MRKIISALASIFIMSSQVSAGIPEIHNLANSTVLVLGMGTREHCSATVIDNRKNLAATANHCAELARTVVYYVDWTDKVSKKVKYEFYVPMVVTQRKMKESGEIYSKQVCEAKVLGVDVDKDIALLKIESRCKFDGEVRLSTDVVNYGDTVYTMGNPFMIYNAVSEGKVTQPKARHENISEGDLPVIMIQGQIAPGSSGGALVNAKGEYIGTTNWGTGMLAFASPVEHLVNLMRKLNV